MGEHTLTKCLLFAIPIAVLVSSKYLAPSHFLLSVGPSYLSVGKGEIDSSN